MFGAPVCSALLALTCLFSAVAILSRALLPASWTIFPWVLSSETSAVEVLLGQGAWRCVGELVAGSSLLIAAGAPEGWWGSSHTVVLLLSSLAASCTSHAVILFLVPHSLKLNVASGPFWLAFCLVGRFVSAPVRARWSVWRLVVTDKVLVYTLALQLALCDFPATVLSSLPPFIIGLLFHLVPALRLASLPDIPILRSMTLFSPLTALLGMSQALSSWTSLDLRAAPVPSTAVAQEPVHTHSHGQYTHAAGGQQNAHIFMPRPPEVEPSAWPLEDEEDDAVLMQRVLMLSHHTAAQERERRGGAALA